MIEIIKDTLIDSIKLLPFLFITYILMEYIEHKMGKNGSYSVSSVEEIAASPAFNSFPSQA